MSFLRAFSTSHPRSRGTASALKAPVAGARKRVGRRIARRPAPQRRAEVASLRAIGGELSPRPHGVVTRYHTRLKPSRPNVNRRAVGMRWGSMCGPKVGPVRFHGSSGGPQRTFGAVLPPTR